jgi:glycosyltransferase involved in cell wall biosynthesis
MSKRLSIRPRDTWRLVRRAGLRGLAQRVVRVAYRRLGAAELEAPIDIEHLADSRGLRLAVPGRRPAPGTPLTIGWICTPPHGGSGGHTTLFRMVEGVEAAGHKCVLYLHDVFHGDLARHERVLRDHWPGMRAEVRSVSDGLAPLDAYVASGWESAHVLACYPEVPTRRLYFIQDFEPLFYPAGSHYVLAEDTYRFGFRPITVGPMLADMLRDRFGVEARVAEFGCDTSVYRLTNPERRNGVVFYAKRDYARRGFVLGLVALREFHRRHPDHEIHVFGDAGAKFPFPVTNHGTLRPAQLSELYNRCAAGIAMSFTNLSLVPDEMLACGVVPVVGESVYSKVSIDNPYVRWVSPTPLGLADALSDIVTGDGPGPAEIAGSIRETPWDDAKRVTLQTIEEEVYGPA